MRRLISILAAGVLAAGTVLTTAGAASAGAAAARQPSCTFDGNFFFDVTVRGVNYFPGTPNSASSGSTVRLKPSTNRTTSWGFCQFSDGSFLVTNSGLAMTSRATSSGANVTVETAGNGGNGFVSQHWFLADSTTFQNVRTGLFLRIRNSGPIMGQTLTTGSSATAWTFP
jgi:hypothetical protein